MVYSIGDSVYQVLFFSNDDTRMTFDFLRYGQICVLVAVAIMEDVAWHLQICNTCFYTMSESWLMGLLFVRQSVVSCEAFVLFLSVHYLLLLVSREVLASFVFAAFSGYHHLYFSVIALCSILTLTLFLDSTIC